MSRRIEVSADTLDAALRRAVADLLGCPEDKVDLRLDAPGMDDVSGTFRLELAVAGPDHTESDDRGPEDDARHRDEPDEPELITPEQLDEEADAAADFLEGLLDA